MNNKHLKIIAIACGVVFAGVVLYANYEKTRNERVETIESENEPTVLDRYECRDAAPINHTVTDETGTNEYQTYFSQCMCYVTDETGTSVWLDFDTDTHTQFQADTPDAAMQLCADSCEKYCITGVGQWLAEHPDFKIQQRG